MTETRYSVCELRLDGRLLRGTAIRYGDEAELPWGVSERFESGAFSNLKSADIILNVMHMRERPLARSGGGGLVLTDDHDRLAIEAKLPSTREADDALELVRTKVYRGLSIEFAAKKESLIKNVRVVHTARLLGVGLVTVPAYKASTIDAMRQRYSARLPTILPHSTRYFL